MILVRIQTLILSSGTGPSVLVLSPEEAQDSPQRNSRIIPIWMGALEATHIGMALEGAKMSRPLTHDLMLDALTNLDASVDHVLINGAEGPLFFSRLTLRQHGRLIDLDARPSDSISLAVREGAPIYIDEVVLQESSYPYIFREGPNDRQELEAFHTFVQNLSPGDFDTSE